MDLFDFGLRLSLLIYSNGMTQESFAKAAGISRVTVSRYVNGKHKPHPRCVISMAKVLGVTPEYLVGLNDRRI